MRATGAGFSKIYTNYGILYPSQLTPHIGTVADGAPIVPISAQLKFNIDVICEYIVKKIPIPVRDFLSSPQLIVIRSFDVNKPGAEVDDLKGGVAGGSIMRGMCERIREQRTRRIMFMVEQICEISYSIRHSFLRECPI
jgi:hypothetical protein